MDRRTEKTKKAIQEAYFSLLMEKGTGRITVSEIARKANIDRKTFYLHYESTEDIVQEFAGDKVGEFLLMLEKEDFFDRPLDERLLFDSLNRLLLKDLELYRQLAADPAFDFVWARMQEALVDAIRKVFSGKVEVSEKEWDVYARFYASGVIAIYAAWLKGEIPFDIERLGEIVADVTYSGAGRILSQNG